MSKEKDKPIHPMEQVFDIEPGSTELTFTSEREVATVASTPLFDEKDQEIEKQFQEVYETAMDAFEQQAGQSELIEPKFRARNEEVAVQYLNTALSAAKEKLTLKQHRDKIAVAEQKANTPGTLNQNLIVGDRNDILRTIFAQDKGENTENENE